MSQDIQPGQEQQPSQNPQTEPDPQVRQASGTVWKAQHRKDGTGQAPWAVLQGDMPQESLDDRDDLYVQCLQNLHQGNSITYAEGYYYFRSQAENYSLCRTEGMGMPIEVVADQTLGAIYVLGDQVYFINVSDNRTLYAVGTDGSGLRKLSDFPMQELVVVEDRIYFRSVYDREYDPFYQLTEEAAEDDRYLYSMRLDGSDCRLLIPQVCLEFTTDGEGLYYLVYDSTHDAVSYYRIYRSSLDGTEEKELVRCENRPWDLLPYRGSLYWADSKNEQLVRLNRAGEQETLASGVWRFTISEGQAYVINVGEIRRVDLSTGKSRSLTAISEIRDYSNPAIQDNIEWYAGEYNRGMFLVNGQIFVRYFESGGKGVLWHIWDAEEGRFQVFEDMEPMAPKQLVRDTSLFSELLFYYPGREDAGTEKCLDAGELQYEEFYGNPEDGAAYRDFSITLPQFNSKLASYEQLNRQMERLMELAMEDKEDFFREIREEEERAEQGYCGSWYRYHGYKYCYIGEKYVSLLYYREGYEGGMRSWMQPMPLVFDRETGELLDMDALFTVDRSVYMKRLTGAVYKYCEMTGMDWLNEGFDNNVLTKKLGDLRCYLTPDGIVLCYERYEIMAGAGGSPTFEIPYEWFADIFR